MATFEAQRMRQIPFSAIRKVFERVGELQGQGRNPVAFHIGRPDFDTPTHIKQAAKEALDRGLTAYTSNFGLLELRQAIAAQLERQDGLRADPERGIIVTVGANEGVLIAMLATLNPDDEVLIPDPMWLHYFYCARLAGARVVGVPLRESNRFQLDPADLERAVTRRTRMLVLNTPHNPTGAVFSRETLEAAADVAYRHGLLVLSDEIYARIVFGHDEHVSPATIERVAGQTILVSGFSKTYAMTGWRLGYVVAPRELIDVMIRVHQYTTVCATSFAQAGAVAALNGPQDCVREMVQEFERRRQVIVEAFENMPGASLVPPQGSFYAFPNLASLGVSSEEVARGLLEDADVAVVPGSAFGDTGEGHVRISFACSLAEVRRGMNNLRQFCAADAVHRPSGPAARPPRRS